MALLTRRLEREPDGAYAGLESIAAADTVGKDGSFKIERVRNGTYWPVFFLDIDRNGRITDGDRISTYRSGGRDSIVVAGEDVADIVLEFASGGNSEIPSTPTILHMDQPYPNPSAGPTGVEFELDRPGIVSLSVFNVMGQEVLTVMNGEHLIHGPHRVSWDASSLASGAYICRLQVDQSSSSRVFFVRR